jgi:antitoxin YefM
VYFLVYTLAMLYTIALKALRPDLPKVADAVASKFDRYIVTKRGQPVMVLVNPEDFEGLLETIEILSDRSALKRIRKARKEARSGKTISLEALRRRLERV